MQSNYITKRVAVSIGLGVLLIFTTLACQPSGTIPSEQKQTVSVKRGNLVVSVESDGNLSLPNQQKLYFEIPGTIQEISVIKGTPVRKGQVIASLDSTAQKLAVEVAQTDMTIARNRFEKRISPPLQGPAYDYLNAPGAYDALDTLYQELTKGIVALEAGDYPDLRRQLFLAQDDVDKVRKMLKEYYIMSFPYGLDEATSILFTLELKKAQLALEKAKEDLKKTQLVAPFDGILADVPGRVGDNLSSLNFSSYLVAHLIDPRSIELKATVEEIDRPKVKVGDEATLAVDALPETIVKGRVTFVSDIATVFGTVVSYRVVIALEPPLDHQLKDGMSTTASIISSRKENILLLPDRAIRDKGNNPSVEVIRFGLSERRPVVVGMSDGKNTEIVSGLSEGEEVLVEPIQAKKQGLF